MEQTEQVTDQTLVAAIREGDEDSATVLYDRYARRVFGLVHAQMSDWLQSMTDPDDIVQSVFKSIFRGVKGGAYEAPPGNTLWSLLAVIAVRKTQRKANHHRAGKRDARREVVFDEETDQELSGADALKTLEIDLREVLFTLRDLDRKVLVSRIQGYTVEEIAVAVNRSGRTIERSLQRIREALADMLVNQSEED